MERFISDCGRTIVLRLDHGDLLLQSLQRLAHGESIDTAAIATGSGALPATHVHVREWCGRPPPQGRQERG